MEAQSSTADDTTLEDGKGEIKLRSSSSNKIFSISENISKLSQNKDKNSLSDVQKIIRKKPIIGVRWILAILGGMAYFTMYFIRNTFPVALVAMVNTTAVIEIPEDPPNGDYGDVCPKALNRTFDSQNPKVTNGEFVWSSQEQGTILGAYFWGFVLGRLFGSRIGEIVGQRACVAVAVSFAGVLELLSPLAANIHPGALAADRFLIGFAYGPLPSSLHSLVSIWAPRDELSSMVTTMFSGATLGGVIGSSIAGWLTQKCGWQITFWIGGGLTFFYLPFWIYFVRNSPAESTNITLYERELLEANKNIKVQKSVPWVQILTSPYIMIIIFCSFARSWSDAVVAVVGPSFLTNKIGLELGIASLVCGANYLFSMIAMLIFGRISDYIIKNKLVSRMFSRRVFHVIGTGVFDLLLLGVSWSGCNAQAVIALWIIMGGTAVATVCSHNVSMIDIAPNYAGTVMGITAFGSLGAAINPMVTSILLEQENGWDKTYYVCAGINVMSLLIYVIFMTDQVQPWNSKEDKEKKEELVTKL